eukprot:TRINITY_DN664_c0_g1_i1.p1 TRINITY_DN664_c0_g1~~TRINITY_DN664_c0_g1_i1.p1  ORF type:complete len:787 (+),score=129.27 TRINITY_DN664_c0_g1_i1:937-3297(+)
MVKYNGHITDVSVSVDRTAFINDQGNVFFLKGNKPQRVARFQQEFADMIKISNNHSLVLSNGIAYTWGNGKHGQLGHSQFNNQKNPRAVAGITNSQLVNSCVTDILSSVVTSKMDIYWFGAGKADPSRIIFDFGYPSLHRSTEWKTLSISGDRDFLYILADDTQFGNGIVYFIQCNTWKNPIFMESLRNYEVVQLETSYPKAYALTSMGCIFYWSIENPSDIKKMNIKDRIIHFKPSSHHILGLSTDLRRSTKYSANIFSQSPYLTQFNNMKNDKNKDVNIILEDGSTFCMHSFILLRIPLFADFLRTTPPQNGMRTINIPVDNSIAFKILYECLYGKPLLDNDNLMSLSLAFDFEISDVLAKTSKIARSLLRKYFRSFLNNLELYQISPPDMKIVGGTGENQSEVYCHSIILKYRCDYFQMMLRENIWAESTNNIVHLPEIRSQEELDIFLYFIYTDSMKKEFVSVQILADLLMLSNQLMINRLQELCCKKLINQLNIDNSLEILEIALLIGYHQLYDSIHEFIVMNLDVFISNSLLHEHLYLYGSIESEYQKNLEHHPTFLDKKSVSYLRGYIKNLYYKPGQNNNTTTTKPKLQELNTQSRKEELCKDQKRRNYTGDRKSIDNAEGFINRNDRGKSKKRRGRGGRGRGRGKGSRIKRGKERGRGRGGRGRGRGGRGNRDNSSYSPQNRRNKTKPRYQKPTLPRVPISPMNENDYTKPKDNYHISTPVWDGNIAWNSPGRESSLANIQIEERRAQKENDVKPLHLIMTEELIQEILKEEYGLDNW